MPWIVTDSRAVRAPPGASPRRAWRRGPTTASLAARRQPCRPLPRRPDPAVEGGAHDRRHAARAQSRPDRRRDLRPGRARAAFDTRRAVSDPRPSAAPLAAVRSCAHTFPPIARPVVDAAGNAARWSARESLSRTPTQLGGALMRKLVGLFAGAAILVAACGGTSATQAPASVGGPDRRRRRARRPRPDRPSAVRVGGRGRDQPVRHAPTRRRRHRPAARSSSATGRKPRSSTRTTSVR